MLDNLMKLVNGRKFYLIGLAAIALGIAKVLLPGIEVLQNFEVLDVKDAGDMITAGILILAGRSTIEKFEPTTKKK